jgi:hypothetical protein
MISKKALAVAVALALALAATTTIPKTMIQSRDLISRVTNKNKHTLFQTKKSAHAAAATNRAIRYCTAGPNPSTHVRDSMSASSKSVMHLSISGFLLPLTVMRTAMMNIIGGLYGVSALT